MEDSKVTVKLSGEANYNTWRFQANVLLKSAGIYDVTTSSKPKKAGDERKAWEQNLPLVSEL